MPVKMHHTNLSVEQIGFRNSLISENRLGDLVLLNYLVELQVILDWIEYFIN